MSRLILSLLTGILMIWLIGGSCWYAEHYGQPNDGYAKITAIPTIQEELPNHNQYHADLQFEKSSDLLIIDDVATQRLVDFANHLKNSGQVLVLTGHYSPFERNDTPHFNLGLARASAVKDFLLYQEVPANQIIIQSFENDHLQFANNLLMEGVHFKMENEYRGKSGMKAQKTSLDQTIEIRPLNLYYNNNEDIVMSSPELQSYLADLKKYLRYNVGSRVRVTGHMDKLESASNQSELSKNRAESVKQLMVTSGIPAKLIITDHKGDSAPIGTNGTPTGRKKNRRVEVRIVQ